MYDVDFSTLGAWEGGAKMTGKPLIFGHDLLSDWRDFLLFHSIQMRLTCYVTADH